jgi:hypothetical protein
MQPGRSQGCVWPQVVGLKRRHWFRSAAFRPQSHAGGCHNSNPCLVPDPPLRRERRAPRIPRIVSFAALFLLAWLLSSAVSRAATFTATFQRNPITMGESAVLVLQFEGGEPAQPPSVPPVSGLTVGFTGRAQHLEFFNGLQRQRITFNYLLSPSRPGDYQLPAIQATVNGQALAAQPPPLKVLPATASPAQDALRQAAFVHFPQPKREVYVGEKFVVQYELHSQFSASGSAPRIESEGFLFGPLIEADKRPVSVNGVMIQRYTYQMTAMATRAGDLVIGPASTKLVLQIPTSRRDIFGFSTTRQQPVDLASELHPIKVLPLPRENVPADFAGAVGSFHQFTVEAGPTNVAVGDPITLRVRIAGRGALDAVKLDAPAQWREFKAYPPSVTLTNLDQLGLQAVKTIEQVIVPENADVKALPALAFSFFDPEARAYRTLTQPPIPLTVRPGAAAPAVPTIVASTNQNNAAPPQQRDIIHIKPRPGTLAAVTTPWMLRPGFWLLNLIPVVAWLGALLWRRNADNLANNPRLHRRREVERLVREGLNELRQQAAANDGAEFFATAFRLLQEQLGERLDLPAAAITEAVIDERLRPAGMDDALLAELHALFQACNQARYAPQFAAQKLEAMANRVEAALRTTAQTEVRR